MTICFDSVLLRGNRSTKVDNGSFDAFASANMEPLAVVGVSLKGQQSFVKLTPVGRSELFLLFHFCDLSNNVNFLFGRTQIFVFFKWMNMNTQVSIKCRGQLSLWDFVSFSTVLSHVSTLTAVMVVLFVVFASELGRCIPTSRTEEVRCPYTHV